MIESIDLHSIGDTHGNDVAACVYAVVHQGVVAVRSRLPKPDLTIPGLELVTAHMAVNLATNIRGLNWLSVKESVMLVRQFHYITLETTSSSQQIAQRRSIVTKT